MSEAELEAAISGIRARLAEVAGTTRENRFLERIRALRHWENKPMDYPEVTANFLKAIHIAYAVCHPDCGTEELIVDGSTQLCQRCGRLMFRTEVKEYECK
jgi:hypothetical protein